MNIHKTALILWTTVDIEYYLIDGDYSKLDGKDISFSEELSTLLFDGEPPTPLREQVSLAEFRVALLSENTVLVQCYYDI